MSNDKMTKDERLKARLLERGEKVKGRRSGFAATATRLMHNGRTTIGADKNKKGRSKNACRRKGRNSDDD
jgi:hypothetical protein